MDNAVDVLTELLDAIEREKLDSLEAAEDFRIRYLSKKQGRVTEVLKQISTIPPKERKAFGMRANEVKRAAEQKLEKAKEALVETTARRRHDVDVTLPGRRQPTGSLHPLTQTRAEIQRVFERFGFETVEGPEIEDEWHNFSALNFPPDHPARDMQDTLFIEASEDGDSGVLLRTHTSPVQIRTMLTTPPPVRVIVPGRVYRNEAVSYKSFCLFHQVEGLYVDVGVSFADLKHVVHKFAQAMFGADVRMRFRPSFFPFTEPSAEVDIWFEDDAMPEGGRWMEILGCGMVDPNVFEAVGVDPEKFTGYAFGLGIERIAMLRHGVRDIRLFYENDFRFLDQF